MSKQLQKAAVNVIGDQACKKFYPIQISSRMVCAGFPQGAVDSCSVSSITVRGSLEQNREGKTPNKDPSAHSPSLGTYLVSSLTSWLDFHPCFLPDIP